MYDIQSYPRPIQILLQNGAGLAMEIPNCICLDYKAGMPVSASVDLSPPATEESDSARRDLDRQGHYSTSD